MTQALDTFANVLAGAWSAETSYLPDTWSNLNPAYGQCAVTALVVQDKFGGEIHRGIVNGLTHYWNVLPGNREVDMTSSQFFGSFTVLNARVTDRSVILSNTATRERYHLLQSRIK